MKVSNKKCIRRLSLRSLKSAMMRNIIAVCAIMLTTVLFTSLFTIAISIGYSFEQSNFRQAGGYNHGTFKYLTREQFETLREDPLIREYGLRRLVGMPDGDPFRKAHVEVGYSDPVQAGWMFIEPEEGRLPQEGTREAATDTRVLSLLGVEPKLGEEFSITMKVDGVETTQTFTLCGWWKYDEAVVASHVLIPQSRAEEIFEALATQGQDGITGSYNLDVMFDSAAQIEKNMITVLENHGYQNKTRTEDGSYISTGVNWGYVAAQFGESIDPGVVLAVSALLALILFTGYLIIYNVFQISVSNDIRFYGLLKTIGTTGRQIRRMILQQAMLLSAIGIPVGLLLGFGVGALLTPVVVSRLDGIAADAVSLNPVIFIGAALFSLITVMISCRRPGKMAARVSPVEAVRYTEGNGRRKTKGKKAGRQSGGNAKENAGGKAVRKAHKGASLFGMARANLGRNRSKTAVTVISLSLAVVLLHVTVLFTSGFDMNKYISRNITTDFVLGSAGHFQVTGDLWNAETALPQEAVDRILEQGSVEEAGRVYGKTSTVMQFITEEYYRQQHGRLNTQETLDRVLGLTERSESGLVTDEVQLYGMEPFALEELKVIEGDLSKLLEPGGRYVAAVYTTDDYGKPEMDSHWAKLGDTITFRYVDEQEYYDPETGELLDPDTIGEGQLYKTRSSKYQDVEYEVAALVSVPYSLSYRYFGADQFVLNDQTFIRDTGTDCVMLYAGNAVEGAQEALESFLRDFTGKEMQQLDYISRQNYVEEFDSFRIMFLVLGGILSFITGLVGILNFLNAVLTGILTRRREFAVLQSVGMTGKQLKTMLVWEGLCYTLSAVAVSLLLGIVMGPLIGKMIENVFWFFSYRFTILPVLLAAPPFAALGVLVPLATYHFVSRHSIVERLREAGE